MDQFDLFAGSGVTDAPTWPAATPPHLAPVSALDDGALVGRWRARAWRTPWPWLLRSRGAG
jgi:hypothetical protein